MRRVRMAEERIEDCMHVKSLIDSLTGELKIAEFQFAELKNDISSWRKAEILFKHAQEIQSLCGRILNLCRYYDKSICNSCGEENCTDFPFCRYSAGN